MFEVIVLLGLFFFSFFLYGKILEKAGYSKWWILVIFIPFVNIVMMWVFAFSKWPNSNTDELVENNKNKDYEIKKESVFMSKDKQTRLAIVISIFWLGFLIVSEIAYGRDFWQEFLGFGLPVWAYWAYRFVSKE